LVYILFLGVYGVDSVLTIVHRLLKRENIFEAHRSHLYQVMANEGNIPHVKVSLIYMAVQAVVCVLVLWLSQMSFGYQVAGAIGILGLLSGGYVIMKGKLVLIQNW
ncbi:MAG: hypothetical protein WD491_04155, partial [Balneolales bacterium]